MANFFDTLPTEQALKLHPVSLRPSFVIEFQVGNEYFSYTTLVCNAPKVGDVEERTGLGGGFDERGEVEYNRHDSDNEEYDDFGRKKKKFRGNENTGIYCDIGKDSVLPHAKLVNFYAWLQIHSIALI